MQWIDRKIKPEGKTKWVLMINILKFHKPLVGLYDSRDDIFYLPYVTRELPDLIPLDITHYILIPESPEMDVNRSIWPGTGNKFDEK